MSNCGLKAIETMMEMKHVSMFSLIHLAKDNGVNLYFCKVTPDELLLVTRPAIFHQKDHFVYVNNGEAMPTGEYTGYVLTPKAIHEPLPFVMAKKVKGGKKGGDILGPIVITIASIINPLLGAAAGSAFQAHKVTGGSGVTNTPGEWWRIPVGGATGYYAGSEAGLGGLTGPQTAGMFAGATELPNAIKTGNYMGAISAGLGQYGMSQFGQGAVSNWAGSSPAMSMADGGVGNAAGQPPSSLLNRVGSAVKGGVQNVIGGTQVAGGGSTGGAGVPTSVPGTSAGQVPVSYDPSGYMGAVGNSKLGNVGNLVQATGGGGAASTGGGLGGILGNLDWKQMAAAGIDAMGKPKQEPISSGGSYAAALETMRGKNYNLPEYTVKQLEEFTYKPIKDIAETLYVGDDRSLRYLEEAKQKAIQGELSRYAAYSDISGPTTNISSQAQQRVDEVSRQYDVAIAEQQQQLQQVAMTQAIDIKKTALQNSIQMNQFDMNSALQLAAMINKDTELKNSIANQDYETFQNIIAMILGSDLLGKPTGGGQ